MQDGKQSMTPQEVRKMYRDQLSKFYKLGIGNKTENGVVVTQTLIDATSRRLNQLRYKVSTKKMQYEKFKEFYE